MVCLLGKVQAKQCQDGDSRSSSVGSAQEPVDRNRHHVIELLSHSDYSVRRWPGRVGESICLNINLGKVEVERCQGGDSRSDIVLQKAWAAQNVKKSSFVFCAEMCAGVDVDIVLLNRQDYHCTESDSVDRGETFSLSLSLSLSLSFFLSLSLSLSLSPLPLSFPLSVTCSICAIFTLQGKRPLFSCGKRWERIPPFSTKQSVWTRPWPGRMPRL